MSDNANEPQCRKCGGYVAGDANDLFEHEEECHAIPPEEQVKTAPLDLRFATMDELTAEIQRRSVGCLIMAYQVEGIRGSYHTKVYGDMVMVRAMSYALAAEVEETLKPKRDERSSK